MKSTATKRVAPRTEPTVHERVRAAIRRHGVARTAEALGIQVETMLRLGAEAPTQRGTMALALMNLPKLEASGSS